MFPVLLLMSNIIPFITVTAASDSSEDVMCGQTIFDVKQLIEAKWGIPASCQRLLRDA